MLTLQRNGMVVVVAVVVLRCMGEEGGDILEMVSAAIHPSSDCGWEWMGDYYSFCSGNQEVVAAGGGEDWWCWWSSTE